MEEKKQGKAWILLLMAGLLAVLAGALFLMGAARAAGERLLISEVVSSNSASLRDADHGSPDWIELYNTSDESIDLTGYTLARADKIGRLYRFPAASIGPGERILVYCSQSTGAGGAIITGFNLPQNGTTLVLASPTGSTLQELRVPALETDISYGLLPEGGYAFFARPTPGAENTGAHGDTLESLMGGGEVLLLTEVLPHAADAGGSWAEFHNAGSTEINLSHYAVSDDPARPGKEKLPEMVLAPGEYGVIYFSDGPAGEPKLGFGLNRRENMLLLSDARGDLLGQITWDPAIFAGISAGADGAGGPVYYADPTPGAANGPPMEGSGGFAMAEGLSDLRITEVLPDNTYSILDRDGDRSPWVELHNAGNAPVELSAYALSDDPADHWKWLLPEGTLGPGEYMVIWLSGKDVPDGPELHTDFRLGSADSALLLSNRGVSTVQTVAIDPESGENISYGMDENGNWLYFAAPTPGAANTAHGFETLSAIPLGGVSSLRINEVSAAQKAKSGKDDWVELYNGSDAAVDLTGWHISDSGNELIREPLEGSIEPGGYLLCGSSLTIAAAGETLYLSDSEGIVVDAFDTGVLRSALSSGRGPTGERMFYKKQTPGEANDEGETFAGYCAAPVFSHMGGYTAGPVSLTISCATEGAEIRYTLDGSTPTEDSRAYTGPIEITKDSIVRAAAFAPGLQQSEQEAATFYFTAHDLPVVCLSMNESDLEYVFGSPRRQEPRERLGYVEYYDVGGRRGTAFPAGFRISGNGTRLYSQRSINLYLRGGYGRSSVTYPFFPGYEVTEFSSLSLRNSGQDWARTRIRDAYFGMVVNGMHVENMQARFAVVYINGEYWGLYELKENQNEDQIASKHGVDPDTVQMVRANTVVYNDVGDSRDIKSLFALASTEAVGSSRFEEYAARVDEAYFTDYLIAQSYFGNSDAFNQKYMRTIDNTLKWRPLLYDLDWCMSSANPKQTTLRSVFFNFDGVETGEPDEFGVRNVMDMNLYCAFYRNKEWQERYVVRFAEVLNTILTTEKMLALYDGMVESVRSEMPRTIERWGRPSSMSQWENNVAALRDCLAERRQYAISEVKSVFGLSDARIQELFPNG